MKTSEFNKIYESAKDNNIASSTFFNTAGYFWIGLTATQSRKMVALMIEQGCKVDDGGYVSLDNGIRLKAI